MMGVENETTVLKLGRQPVVNVVVSMRSVICRNMASAPVILSANDAAKGTVSILCR
jgi:hypothetical protein